MESSPRWLRDQVVRDSSQYAASSENECSLTHSARIGPIIHHSQRLIMVRYFHSALRGSSFARLLLPNRRLGNELVVGAAPIPVKLVRVQSCGPPGCSPGYFRGPSDPRAPGHFPRRKARRETNNRKESVARGARESAKEIERERRDDDSQLPANRWR